jgi:8-oxo-dGTP pyrophosphatase MutT (NUDIX family)
MDTAMIELERVLTNLRADSGEARGALAVLELLGLIRLNGEQAAPTGEVAGFVLDSLRAHLADGVTAGLDWEQLDGDGLRGVDLIRVLEESRVDRVETPTPARVVQVVQGVIKVHTAGGDRYLMQYDAPAGRYQWIGGKQDPGDASPEAALRREIYEELALDAPPGPDACTLTRLESGWPTLNLSATYGILTGYAFTTFNVEVVRFRIPTDADTRWLSLEEIAAGRADDGRSVQGLGALSIDRLAALPPGVES